DRHWPQELVVCRQRSGRRDGGGAVQHHVELPASRLGPIRVPARRAGAVARPLARAASGVAAGSVGGGPEGSARIVMRESLAPLLRLIVHFADLALPAKTPTHNGVHRTDSEILTHWFTMYGCHPKSTVECRLP